MRVPFPQTFWWIEVSGSALRLNLVRAFMSRENVLKTVTIPGFTELTETEKREKLVSALGKKAGLSRVFFSLPREQGIVRELQLPVDVQQDLKSALTLQIEAISAWPEQEVYWDYIAEKSKDNPKLLAVTIVIVPKPVLDPWLELFDAIEVPLSGATIQSFSTNVIPEPMRSRFARAQVMAAYVLAACVVLVAIAIVAREPYEQRVYAGQIQTEIRRLEPEVKTLVREEAELGSLTRRYQLLKTHLDNRDSNLRALKALATVLPPDTFVTNYRLQNDTINVIGVSASALAVQSALETSPVFKDVQFASPITRDPTGKDRFTIKMSIEGRP